MQTFWAFNLQLQQQHLYTYRTKLIKNANELLPLKRKQKLKISIQNVLSIPTQKRRTDGRLL